MAKPTPTSRKGSRALRRSGFALVGILTLLLLGLLSGGVAAYVGYFKSQQITIKIPGLDPPPRQRPGPQDQSTYADSITNIILVGSDSREALPEEDQAFVGDTAAVGGQRSDTLILVHLDPRKEKAVLVHFPRDLRTEIPGVGTDRINTAYNYGGPELVVKTVKRLTKLKIHHYVEVNFAGFKKLVEALDGVEICIDRPMIDRVSRLFLQKKGCYNLGGRKALAFVRARHVEDDVIPDFARITRQQQFIRALLNKLLSVKSLLQPSILQATAKNFTTDAELRLADMAFFADQLRGLGSDKGDEALDFRVVPSVPQSIDDKSYVVPVEPDATEFFARLKKGEPLEDLGARPTGERISNATVEVTVLDAGNARRAKRMRARLRKAGFALAGIRPSPDEFTQGIILFREGKEEEAEVLHGYFPELEVRQAGKRLLGDADVGIVVVPKRSQA